MGSLTRSRAAGEFFVSGGTLPPDSRSYIERRADGELLTALRKGNYCYILNSRQMGKSSLSVRTIAKLGAEGTRTAFIDLTQIGGRNVSPEQWYAGLSMELGRLLGLRTEIMAYLKEQADTSPMQRLFAVLREVVLKKVEAPLVIFIDEIDATKNLSFNTDEFFAGIRECFNRRVREEDLKRLTFCLLGVAVPSDLISNPATTPFNIGERILLQDFTLEELEAFAPELGFNGASLIERIYYWTEGQPYLTQSLCQVVVERGLSSPLEVDGAVEDLFFGVKSKEKNVNLADVANRVLNADSGDADPDRFRADLLSMYERTWKGGKVKDDEVNRAAVVLKLSGLLRTDGSRLHVRNRIYRSVFDLHWVEESMPQQELRRQAQSFRRGMARGISLATAIVATISVLGIIAWRSRQDAVAAKSRLDYELYVSDMNGMRYFEQTGDIARMEQVLRRTQASPHRGFEWGFWNRRLHDAPEEYSLDYSAPGKREDGILSRDGRYICILDELLRVAAVVERRTRKPVKTIRLSRQTAIVSTSRGLVRVDPEEGRLTVRDLLTGEMVCQIDQPARSNPFFARRYTDYLHLPRPSEGDSSASRRQLWNIVTGKLVWSETTENDTEPDKFYSDDGSRLLTWRSGPVQIVEIFDLQSRKTVDRFAAPKDFHNYHFTGKRLLYYVANSHIGARDVDAHKELFRWQPGEEGLPQSAEFTYDLKKVVLLYSRGQAEVRDAATGLPISVRLNAWSVSLAPIGNTLVVGSSSVRVVSALESPGAAIVGRANRVARDGAGQIRAVDDSNGVVSVFNDPEMTLDRSLATPPRSNFTYNSMWFLDRRDAPQAGAIAPVDGKGPRLSFSPPPSNIAGGSKGDVFAVLIGSTGDFFGVDSSGKRLWQRHVDEPIRGFWITPDSSRLVLMSGETRLAVHDPRTGKRIALLDAHNVRLTNLCFPSAQTFFTCGADGRAILWDTRRLKVIQQFKGNAVQRISGADLSPDGKRAATCSFAGSWQLWDVETGAQLMDYQASNQALRGIVFTADGKSLVTAGEDGKVRVWSTLADPVSVRVPLRSELVAGIKP